MSRIEGTYISIVAIPDPVWPSHSLVPFYYFYFHWPFIHAVYTKILCMLTRTSILQIKYYSKHSNTVMHAIPHYRYRFAHHSGNFPIPYYDAGYRITGIEKYRGTGTVRWNKVCTKMALFDTSCRKTVLSNTVFLSSSNIHKRSDMNGIWTTRAQDNSYPGQFVPKTTRTQDNSNPWQLVPGQDVPWTTRIQDNSIELLVVFVTAPITIDA